MSIEVVAVIVLVLGVTYNIRIGLAALRGNRTGPFI